MSQQQPSGKLPSIKTLVVLSLLYFAQGLPFGFQATALPAYLRGEGLSLVGVGFLGALSLPWALKVLWAPVVDRYGWEGFGRRKSWIVPMQLLLGLTCFAVALLDPGKHLSLVLGLVLLMNLFAATQDIAVDGLAVSMLPPEALGAGNAAQVVGYKLGMLTGGGLLVWASASLGWQGLFAGMGGLILAVLLGVLLLDESAAVARAARTSTGSVEVAWSPPPSFEVLFLQVREALRAPGTGWLLLFIGSYKVGEAMADAMFKPFLIDHGFTPAQLGLYLGTFGMVASLLGSAFGGYLATRLSFEGAVGWAALLRVLPMVAQVWLALGVPTASTVIPITVLEHFFGGALTATVFALMMSRVDRRVGGTHYTLLATVEVLGKSPGIWASGFLAQALGYPALFALGAILSLLFLGTLVPLRRSR